MPRTRKGFTLIELLIVVVIIGILAAIAIPKFSDTKEKAFITSMKNDLRNLGPAAEAWYDTNQGDYAGLTVPAPSNGGNPITYNGDPTGWTASATHPGAAGITCDIFVGANVPAGRADGEVRCQ